MASMPDWIKNITKEDAIAFLNGELAGHEPDKDGVIHGLNLVEYAWIVRKSGAQSDHANVPAPNIDRLLSAIGFTEVKPLPAETDPLSRE